MAKIIVGATARNKVNGKRYIVTEVSISTITLAEQLPEGAEETPEILFIPAKSAETVLEVVSDPREKEVPTGYSVENGILYNGNGEVATEQGQLSFVAVLGAMADRVILSAKTRDRAEDKVEIFAYLPLEDKFKKLTRPVTEAKPILELCNEDRFIAQLTTIENVVKVDEDGYDVVDDDGNKVLLKNVTNDIIIYDGTETSFCNSRIDSPKAIMVDKGAFALAGETVLVTDDDNCVSDFEKKDETTVELFTLQGCCSLYAVLEATVFVPSDGLLSVTKNPEYGFVVKTAGSLWVENRGHRNRKIDSPVLKEYAAYEYLVSADIRNDSEEYILADEDYNVVTIRKEKTYDRGDIISVIK